MHRSDQSTLSLRSLLQDLLQRLSGLLPGQATIDWADSAAAVWYHLPFGGELRPHTDVDPISLDDLLAVDRQKAALELNTRQFLAGLPANNVLLWGARGSGKSSLIHGLLNRYRDQGLRLIEVDKQGLSALPEIAAQIREAPYRFILFCDDLSFEADDPSYKALKSLLEGTILRAADNLLVYATSNRRHLLPEYMRDNLAVQRDADGELHDGEAIEEKVSLSDRFGVWLSFYPLPQQDYLAVVGHWLDKLGRQHGSVQVLTEEARLEALQWARARGARNGRTAQYFARHWIGRTLLDAGQA
jgi:uncharacterized protein